MVEIERLGLPQLITNYFALVLLIPIFHSLNPLNPKIKITILICHPYSFTIEVVGRS